MPYFSAKIPFFYTTCVALFDSHQLHHLLVRYLLILKKLPLQINLIRNYRLSYQQHVSGKRIKEH